MYFVGADAIAAGAEDADDFEAVEGRRSAF
jgi:hypothetical protein